MTFIFQPFGYVRIKLYVVLQVIFIAIALLLSTTCATAGTNILSLNSAVAAAQLNDPWLIANQHSQDAVESLSIAAGTLPDPKISVNILNIPTDSFDFNQENMSQFKVGISQMFPRGKSLALKQKQLEQVGSQFPFQRQNRRAQVVVNVGRLWMDAYNAQQSITLIEKNRPLFEQLVDVAEANYSSALGRTRQQDIVRAQLELTLLNDRLTILKQKQEMFVERLSEWLSDYFLEQYKKSAKVSGSFSRASLELDRTIPDIQMLEKAFFTAAQEVDPQNLYAVFSRHPTVLALEQKIKARGTGIDLAKQTYKPEWGLNASYSYRDDTPGGNDRADFVSLSLQFELPLFTGNRQDKVVESAVSLAAAVKTEKWLLLRRMIAGFEKARAQLYRLNQRQNLYRKELLPQMHEQAEASLTAYTNDDGDFAEVVRARIAELNASIDALGIDVERQKTIIQLNYYFMKNGDDIIADYSHTGELQ